MCELFTILKWLSSDVRAARTVYNTNVASSWRHSCNRDDISSLPVPDAKFQEAKSDYLGPLIVTPEMVAKKIKAMKEKKSPGVDGIPPKLLIETVEQIRIPLARVFNLSLKEGVVPVEWNEANIMSLFKKGS